MINYFYVENAYAGENTLTLNSGYGKIVDGQSGLQLQFTTTPNIESSWTTIRFDTDTKNATIPISKGDKVYLRGTNLILGNGNNKTKPIISCTQNFNVGGDLTTLIVPEGHIVNLGDRNYCFSYLFKLTKLVNASNLILPSIILSPNCYYGMFSDCSLLIQTPKLPATDLSVNCYRDMFYNCSSLIELPTIYAKKLAESCYSRMFGKCTSIKRIPNNYLPIQKLAIYCYKAMFSQCTSLTYIPENLLTSTTLADYCYNSMFQHCHSNTSTLILPALDLTTECYKAMFSSNLSLTQAPELPATILSSHCYDYMFKECTSLTQAPDLPATILAEGCYSSMFKECTSLNKVTALFTNNSASGCLDNWLTNVAPTGTFIHHPDLDAPLPNSYIPDGWTSVKPKPDYFKINSVDENKLSITGTHDIEYRKGEIGSWTKYSTPVVFTGDLYLRGQNQDLSSADSNKGTIKCTKPFSTESDITTMLNILGDRTLRNSFNNIFKDCNIKEANVSGSNLTNRAQTYVYDGAHVESVTLMILNNDNTTYSEWIGNIGPEGKLVNLRRTGYVE